jgi:1-acyl-sn-glycerol-3-phosphate acyltransferase
MKPRSFSSTPTPSLGIYLRSALFFFGMVLATMLISPLLILAAPLPFSRRYALAQLWVRTCLWMLDALCRLKFEVQGSENIPAGSAVILCKHQSAWETIALQAIFPPMSFILKRELLRIPLWGWAMATLEPIAIDRSARSAALKQVLRDGETRLKAGRWVVIFPEGTRVPPGRKGRYNASGGMLAHRVGCLVIPVAHNAGEFWARKAFLKYPGTIQVRIGPAIDARQFNANEIIQRAEAWIEAQMEQIGQTMGSTDTSDGP